MQQCQLSYKDSTIGYYVFGSGPRVAACFHGYGEDGRHFAFLGTHAGADFTFYAIDLPFHGSTEWAAGAEFSATDLREIVRAITGDPPGITLIGFSLGGRMALSLITSLPGAAGKLLLLAPDGLKVNFWYWLSTQTWPGNRLFAFTMKHPGWFFGFLKLLNALGLVNASIFKFVNYYIGDKKARQLLYDRWTTLRKIKPNLALVKEQINKNNIPTRLLYGRHDRIILSSVGERFRHGIENNCTISVIHSGHQVLHEKHVNEILPALLH